MADSNDPSRKHGASRRDVLRGAGAALAAAPLLTSWSGGVLAATPG
ncbi:MAG: twin-arginine translocation signal domain-containing protein [Proteobacteria bacterium]|nr:twin-arginine translocation signal domain-containing protein [Pseudomonadota bacterium]